jgi:hypothetical protein
MAQQNPGALSGGGGAALEGSGNTPWWARHMNRVPTQIRGQMDNDRNSVNGHDNWWQQVRRRRQRGQRSDFFETLTAMKQDALHTDM